LLLLTSNISHRTCSFSSFVQPLCPYNISHTANIFCSSKWEAIENPYSYGTEGLQSIRMHSQRQYPHLLVEARAPTAAELRALDQSTGHRPQLMNFTGHICIPFVLSTYVTLSHTTLPQFAHPS
jgi:hypothetical protein